MKQRSKDIDEAMKKAKARDGYKCLKCGQGREHGMTVIGSHLFVRNNAFPNSRPDDPDQIMTLCSKHDRLYDLFHSPEQKRDLLIEWGLFEWATRLEEIAGLEEAIISEEKWNRCQR